MFTSHVALPVADVYSLVLVQFAFTQACIDGETSLVQWGCVDAKKFHPGIVLMSQLLGFGTACTNCLQVEAIVTNRSLIF